MTKPYTQGDDDCLADIIWWIMGYHAASEDSCVACDFKSDHLEALRRARAVLKEMVLDKQKEEK